MGPNPTARKMFRVEIVAKDGQMKGSTYIDADSPEEAISEALASWFARGDFSVEAKVTHVGKANFGQPGGAT